MWRQSEACPVEKVPVTGEDFHRKWGEGMFVVYVMVSVLLWDVMATFQTPPFIWSAS